MEIWHYPMLCWPAGDEAVCGHLVGLGWEQVAPSVEKLRTAFARRLQKAVEEDGRPPRPPLSEVEFKVARVEFRPAYRDREGTYPEAGPVHVPVAAVCGANPGGSFTCFLPLLEASFYYYRRGQADPLIEHFARDAFRGMTPERIHRLLLVGAPSLDRVVVKIKGPRRETEAPSLPPRVSELLAAAAERHPYPKGVRSRIRAVPTAAWERGLLVRAVLDKIIGERASVLLVGEPGVGKSAILHETVRRIHAGGKPKGRTPEEELLEAIFGEAAAAPVSDRPHFWKTSARRLISSARYLGDWQEICEDLAGALREAGDVLWIEDVPELLQVGGDGPEDSVAAFLVPFLGQEGFRIAGEIAPRELEAMRSILPGFADRFQIVRVEELARAPMLKVLDEFAAHARKSLGIDLDRRALEAAHRLLDRWAKYERFPGKAIAFLTECLNAAALERRTSVGDRDVLARFTEESGLPEVLLRDDLPLDREELSGFFRRRILGQDRAVERVAQSVTVLKAGLNDPAKPVATLLLAGPTGVGKTATARALAAYCFGAGQRLHPLLRIDMSEYQHPSQVERLIGSPGGAPGRLLQHLRERPFSVVLLDEIEKAHPAFFDVLLAVLDEGLLVDAYGRTTDFRNSILVMTTNLGTRREGTLGFGADAPGRVEADVRAFFRPEFFNRIDQLIVFEPLGPEVILGIARKELGELVSREGFAKRGIRLEFTDALVRSVADLGFDPVYGARPLQRAIEHRVVGPLARHLLAHPAFAGLLRVDIAEGEVCIS